MSYALARIGDDHADPVQYRVEEGLMPLVIALAQRIAHPVAGATGLHSRLHRDDTLRAGDGRLVDGLPLAAGAAAAKVGLTPNQSSIAEEIALAATASA